MYVGFCEKDCGCCVFMKRCLFVPPDYVLSIKFCFPIPSPPHHHYHPDRIDFVFRVYLYFIRPSRARHWLCVFLSSFLLPSDSRIFAKSTKVKPISDSVCQVLRTQLSHHRVTYLKYLCAFYVESRKCDQ